MRIGVLYNRQVGDLYSVLLEGRESSVGIAMGYGLDGRGSIRGEGKKFFFSSSTPALEPTHHSIQWVPGVISLGVKRPGREVDHSPS
jgi:hypothetical protein